MLVDFALEKAFRAQGTRIPIDLKLRGSLPCSSDEAQAAVYWSLIASPA